MLSEMEIEAISAAKGGCRVNCFSLAFRYKTDSGETVIVPEYVSEDWSEFETSFGNYSYQSLSKERDAFGYSIVAKVARALGEAVSYAGEVAGMISPDYRIVEPRATQRGQNQMEQGELLFGNEKEDAA